MFLFQPGRIVALPGNTLTPIEFKDPACNVVEKVSVMSYCNDGTRVALKITLQPRDRFSVQVIGRLVQQQHVWFCEQQTTQGNSALFTAGQVFNLCIPRR